MCSERTGWTTTSRAAGSVSVTFSSSVEVHNSKIIIGACCPSSDYKNCLSQNYNDCEEASCFFVMFLIVATSEASLGHHEVLSTHRRYCNRNPTVCLEFVRLIIKIQNRFFRLKSPQNVN